ncbi:tubulin-like doman-containing protein [Haloglomus litoreum]|uniref:tubulin-like doman-containing protein n=1 Tax=Haloglomus litoreum TaxID=3034026 RepID=UPI0023E75A6C|nr:tubulin-like doman-containing protein [Haloglomus sp. DT116]
MSSGRSRTVVVGAGGAGIDVLAALAGSDGAGWGTTHDDRFEYVAVAADPAALGRAPEGATEVRLAVDPDDVADARATHPYLRPDGVGADGQGRQRPVGRYALDSRGGDARSALRDAVDGAFDSLLAGTDSDPGGIDDERVRSCNVVHVHALDDGLGSGSFPLVAHVLDAATDERRERHGVSTYVAGIGIIPELSHGVGSGFESIVPPGERWRYANTYAALRDLETLTLSTADDPLPVHLHAERDGAAEARFVLGADEPQGYIDGSPYRHHFLVGDGGHRTADAAGPGPAYAQRVEAVVGAIHGLAALGPGVHTWLTPPSGTAHFGSFGQSELSVPIEDVRAYCRLDERVAELEGRLGGAESAAGGERSGEAPDDIEAELAAARAEREAVVERLTTPRYGPRRGRLALDERMVRRHLDRETLRTELTSLRAFDEAGYLVRDLQTVLESRLPLACAWQSRLLTWSEGSAGGTVGGHYGGRREVWMLHSEENTDLPSADRTEAGQHTFRRSGENAPFPPFADPYTVQFLTYCVEAPLSDLRVYAELDGAAASGRLDELLETWDDHRQAFAYPEWYDRDLRRYFGIRTRVDLPRPPELDLDAVRTERTGADLATWVSSHGLASYLWLGDEWDRYEGYITTHGTDPVGWRAGLADHGLSYQDMRALVPNGEPVARWVAGDRSWRDLLSQVTDRLAEREGLSVAFIDGEST